MRTVPVIVIPARELGALPIDEPSGRVLRCIDGRASLESVLDASGLAEDEARGIMEDLVSFGAVTLVEVDERLTARSEAARR
jgi:hypothetical protein